MRRMLLSEYRRHAFVGKPSSANTVINWIHAGDLPGEKMGGTWIVFLDDKGEPLRSTGNALADAALSRWQDQKSSH